VNSSGVNTTAKTTLLRLACERSDEHHTDERKPRDVAELHATGRIAAANGRIMIPRTSATTTLLETDQRRRQRREQPVFDPLDE
jgi:hypothetical protein